LGLVLEGHFGILGEQG